MQCYLKIRKIELKKLNIFISLLVTCMLIHGTALGDLLHVLSTLVPIPKIKRGDKSDSSNYEAIAISSLLNKIFDFIGLFEQCQSYQTDNLQFGFNKIRPKKFLFVQHY